MSKSQRIASTAVLAALITITSMLSIPLGTVPLSLQCFTVAIGAYIFGFRSGVCATVLYLCIGAVGLPVFAGVRGGVAVLLDYTGGFLWGFIALAFLCGIASGKKRWVALVLGVAGACVCHAFGVAQFCLVSGVSLKNAFITASAPFLLKDMLFVAAAQFISVPVLKALRKNEKSK